MLKKTLRVIDSTTYKVEGKYDVIFGDEKDPDFKPRTKLKPFDNESNISFGVDETPTSVSVIDDVVVSEFPDMTVRQYGLTPEIHSSPDIKWNDLGTIAPERLLIAHELPNHIPNSGIYITSGRSNIRAISHFGHFDSRSLLDESKVDVPEFRATSLWGNPMEMWDTLDLIDFQCKTTDPCYNKLQNLFTSALVSVLFDMYDITATIDGGKVFIGDQKIASGELSQGHYWTTLVYGNHYNDIYNRYKVKPRKFDKCDGLFTIYPSKDFSQLTAQVIRRFSSTLKKRISRVNYTQVQLDKVNSLVSEHKEVGWIKNRNRSSANWFYRSEETKNEYEIVLKSKPPRKIPFTFRSKNMRAFKQRIPLGLERNNVTIPPDSENGYFFQEEYMGNIYTKEEFKKKNGGGFASLYRPNITDANGKSAWCEFEIPTIIDWIDHSFLANSRIQYVSDNIDDFQSVEEVDVIGKRIRGDTGLIDHTKQGFLVIPKEFHDDPSVVWTDALIDPTLGDVGQGTLNAVSLNTIRGWTIFGADLNETNNARFQVATMQAYGVWTNPTGSIIMSVAKGFLGSLIPHGQTPDEVHKTTGNPVYDKHEYELPTFEVQDGFTYEPVVQGDTGGYELLRYSDAGGFMFGSSEPSTYTGTFPVSWIPNFSNSFRISSFAVVERYPSIIIGNADLEVGNAELIL